MWVWSPVKLESYCICSNTSSLKYKESHFSQCQNSHPPPLFFMIWSYWIRKALELTNSLTHKLSHCLNNPASQSAWRLFTCLTYSTLESNYYARTGMLYKATWNSLHLKYFLNLIPPIRYMWSFAELPFVPVCLCDVWLFKGIF